MPSRFKVLSILGLIAATAVQSVLAYDPPTAPAPKPFRYDKESFAFANETVWNYVDGSVQAESRTSTKKRAYTRRCFVVTRAAVQFWKFARFDVRAPALAKDKLAKRIRDVTGRDVWGPALPLNQRVVFPGYANVHALSAAFPSVFQENIGLGWPVYVRPGNAPIAVPVTRATEARLNGEILRDLAQNYPTIVWLYLFPSLQINHVVVVISGQKRDNRYRYEVYDPNYTDGPKRLDYDPSARTFSYQPTFFFKGGAVDARAIYRGVLQ